MRFPERGLHVSWSFWLLILLAAIVSPLTIVLSILLAAALHECGHLLALRAFHVPIEGLRLSAFGAVLHARGAQRLSYGRELVVTLAGCGMNLVCGVLTAWFSLHYVWVEGFVFAPGKGKRDAMRQMEAVLHSISATLRNRSPQGKTSQDKASRGETSKTRKANRHN